MIAHITKTWIEDGKLVTEVIEAKDVYKREWVGLTDEEINVQHIFMSRYEMVKYFEAKLKEKNS